MEVNFRPNRRNQLRIWQGRLCENHAREDSGTKDFPSAFIYEIYEHAC